MSLHNATLSMCLLLCYRHFKAKGGLASQSRDKYYYYQLATAYNTKKRSCDAANVATTARLICLTLRSCRMSLTTGSSANILKHFFFVSLFLTLSFDHTTPSWSINSIRYFSHAKDYDRH